MTRALIIVLCGPLVLAASPLLAAEYTVKIEHCQVTQIKVGNKKSYTSDRHTLEILSASDRRFQGQATWGKERLSIKGKLSEAEDRMLELEIDCGHFRKIELPAAERFGGPLPEIENKCSATTRIKLVPGQEVFLGGGKTRGTAETPDGLSEIKEETSLRVTLIEEKPAD